MTHREIAMKEFVIEDNGTTPLFLASSRGHLEVVEHLLEARADKDGRFIGGFLVWVGLFVFSVWVGFNLVTTTKKIKNKKHMRKIFNEHVCEWFLSDYHYIDSVALPSSRKAIINIVQPLYSSV